MEGKQQEVASGQSNMRAVAAAALLLGIQVANRKLFLLFAGSSAATRNVSGLGPPVAT
jgi:hypothetical protein